jgi:hypothetical protein
LKESSKKEIKEKEEKKCEHGLVGKTYWPYYISNGRQELPKSPAVI